MNKKNKKLLIALILIVFIISTCFSYLVLPYFFGTYVANHFLVGLIICPVYFLVFFILILVLAIYYFKKEQSRLFNFRTAAIFCIIIIVINIMVSTLIFLPMANPHGILNKWVANDEKMCNYPGQYLPSYCSFLIIGRESTYNWRWGVFYEPNLTGNGLGVFIFEWDYDPYTGDFTFFYSKNDTYKFSGPAYDYTNELYSSWWGEYNTIEGDWEIKLKLDIVGDKKMISRYISDVNMNFAFEFFDNITWTGIWDDWLV